MGRQCGQSLGGAGFDPTPFALFRYNLFNQIDTQYVLTGKYDHFSIDHGATSIVNDLGEGNGGDLGDYNFTTNDCCGYANPGTRQIFTPTDIKVMHAIGWA